MTTNKGLGRGLGSLLGILDNDEEKVVVQTGKDNGETAKRKNGVIDINIALIDRNPAQPRKNFDPTLIQELAESIKQYGLIQPIVVKEQNGRYLIVAGERRFRASKLAGLKSIPAIIKDYDERQIKEIALLENIQREDLNPIEIARAMNELLKEYNWTQEQLADKLGKSRPAVANFLRLLSLCPQVIEMIESGKLSAGHARSLVVVQNPEVQIKLAELAIVKRLTVRDMENAVKQLSGDGNKKAVKQSISLELTDFCSKLQHSLSTKVNIKGNGTKGKIIINYYNADDLDRIYNTFIK